jgi:hypothetical protein
MRSTQFAALLLAAMPLASWASNSYVVPTTTLSAQTGNNTSAANGFPTQMNGNLAVVYCERSSKNPSSVAKSFLAE